MVFNQLLFSCKVNQRMVQFIGWSDNHSGNQDYSVT
jgi:hypothetical protein